MEKTVTANPKRANNKQTKSKKQKQPLKIVYFTNPIKLTATASEFRSLVQELTGQDADLSNSSRFAAAGGGAEKAAPAEGNAHAAEEVGRAAARLKGACEDDRICTSEMLIDSCEAYDDMWLEDVDVEVDLDVFKGLGAS